MNLSAISEFYRFFAESPENTSRSADLLSRLRETELFEQTPPKTEVLWLNVLHILLTPFETRLIHLYSAHSCAVLRVCRNLNNYISGKNLTLQLKKTEFSLLPEARREQIMEQILCYHPIFLKFMDPEEFSKIQKTSNESVLNFSHDYEVEPWDLALLFRQIGLQTFFSKQTARRFDWFQEISEKPDFLRWYRACEMLDKEQGMGTGFILNVMGDLFFDEDKKPDFTQNFLIGDVHFPESRFASFTESVGNKLLSEQSGSIGNEDLLRYVLRNASEKNLEGFSDWDSFRKSYYETFSKPSPDTNPEKTNQFLFWKAFRELSGRLNAPRDWENPALSDAGVVFENFKHLFINEKQENFYALLLNSKNRLIESVLITKGLLDQVQTHPREVFSPAIKMRAKSIILIHNHPTGNPEPSKSDERMTVGLKNVGKMLGIEVLDHIIFGENTYFSFSENSPL